MLDMNALHETVAQLVSLASGIPQTQVQSMRDGKVPELSGLYATIKLIEDKAIGKPAPRYRSTATPYVLDEEIVAQTQIQCSINFFRLGAVQLANNMKTAAYRDAVQAFLFTNNMAWVNFGPINDLTQFFSGYYEERAQAKLYLWLEGVDVGQVGHADKVDVSITDENTAKIETFYANDLLN